MASRIPRGSPQRHLFRLLAAHARTGLADACASGDTERWIRLIELLRDTEAHLEANVNLRLALENFVAQWAAGQGTAMAGR